MTSPASKHEEGRSSHPFIHCVSISSHFMPYPDKEEPKLTNDFIPFPPEQDFLADLKKRSQKGNNYRRQRPSRQRLLEVLKNRQEASARKHDQEVSLPECVRDVSDSDGDKGNDVENVEEVDVVDSAEEGDNVESVEEEDNVESIEEESVEEGDVESVEEADDEESVGEEDDEESVEEEGDEESVGEESVEEGDVESVEEEDDEESVEEGDDEESVEEEDSDVPLQDCDLQVETEKDVLDSERIWKWVSEAESFQKRCKPKLRSHERQNSSVLDRISSWSQELRLRIGKIISKPISLDEYCDYQRDVLREYFNVKSSKEKQFPRTGLGKRIRKFFSRKIAPL